MKTVIIVPDGTGIRNFLCSSFIDCLLEDGEVCVWHALPEAGIAPHRGRWGDSVRWETLPTFREGLVERVLRQAKIDAQLRWRYEEDSGEVILASRRPSKRLVSRLVMTGGATLGRICGRAQGAIWLDKMHARATLAAHYLRDFEAFLAHEQPDVVFCTHQRASRAVPAMLAARKLDIPTATFIYSWDNLPKGRMAVHADHFLVWSDYMKEELLGYYPEVATERVHVVGTPQFEFYFQPELIEPREQFLGRLGLDLNRPVICFSGDDVTTSPYDPCYLADLAEALRTIPSDQCPQLLFRRCPVDQSDRYDSVLARYPEIAISEPLWQEFGEEDWTQIVPTAEDIALLVNIVSHCDLVVNIGSTMALDFAVLDKPGIYLHYQTDRRGEWQSEHIYGLPHFTIVHKLAPVDWAESRDELCTLVERVLADRSRKQKARRSWLEMTARQPLANASERCVQALARIGAEKAMQQVEANGKPQQIHGETCGQVRQ